MLETVKKALRISHSKLDSEIERYIETAKAELIRVGTNEEVVKAGGNLVTQAIVTYCLMNMQDDPRKYELYDRSWNMQIDAIRRSSNVQ